MSTLRMFLSDFRVALLSISAFSSSAHPQVIEEILAQSGADSEDRGPRSMPSRIEADCRTVVAHAR